RQAAHRFTPSAWKSLRLSHNHLDNCSAVTHIPTRLIITDSIGQRTKIIQLWDKAKNFKTQMPNKIQNPNSKVLTFILLAFFDI
ncbi:hypothetical protein M1O56_01910, partial [Dehalococcoidia bacterium]|nr:hypothetical protein [Dehalococcoidia bacterium]